MVVKRRTGEYLTICLCNKTGIQVSGQNDPCPEHNQTSCVETYYSASGLAENITAVRDGKRFVAGFWPQHWWQRLLRHS